MNGDEMVRHVVRMVEMRNVHKILVGKPAGKRPLGRPRRRWEDNNRLDRREIGKVRTTLIWLRIGTIGRLL
jgi:hypothetical protein